MASLYRPTVIRFVDATGKRVSKSTPGAKRVREKSDTWRGKFKGADGKSRTVTLSDDRDTAESMLADHVKRSRREAAGDVDPFEAHRKRPLADHVADFRQYLESKANTSGHVRQTCSRIEAAFNACHFTKLADLSAGRVSNWLADQRKAGLSIATSNHHWRAIKAFGGWLVRDRRCPENPFAHVALLNGKADIRRERRTLADDELSRLIATAETDVAPYRGLIGSDRSMVYRLATFTGLRAGELASLTESSFDLSANPPIVTLEAAYSKHRRKDVLPLHPNLADSLQKWLAARRMRMQPTTIKLTSARRATSERLFPGSWCNTAGRMIRDDLEAARQAWLQEVETDAMEFQRRDESDFLKFENGHGEFADFHALRHTFVTRLASGGVHPKLAQGLARHSTITLTMDRYSHLGLLDLNAALASLPNLPDTSVPSKAAMLATGTDDRDRSNRGALVAPMVALRPVQPNQNQPSATVSNRTKTGDARKAETPHFQLENEGLCMPLMTVDVKGSGRSRTDDDGFAIRCLSHLATEPTDS